MRCESILSLFLLAVAAAPSLAYPVDHSTRELGTDVYERGVADDFDLYARQGDAALNIFQRSEYEARDDEGLAELLARAFDEMLAIAARSSTSPPQAHPVHTASPRPDSPPPGHFHGHTKVGDRVHKLPTIKERSFDFDGAMNLN